MFKPSLMWTASAVIISTLALGACGDDSTVPPVPDPDPGVVETKLRVEIKNVSIARSFAKSGAFDTPVGKGSPAPIGPGEAYEFSFSAPFGSALSLATMFVHSNDLFYAPDEQGIALYDANGTPTSGDVTGMIKLWDAGTEKDEEPGMGPNQAPRQTAKNTGEMDPMKKVGPAEDAFNNLPSVSDVIKVTLTPMADSMFKVRIENVSTSNTLKTSDMMTHAVPLAPGVWVVHGSDSPLFESGRADRGEGLEALAEDGDPSGLAMKLSDDTGVTQLLAPGVWALHRAGMPLFESGKVDPGTGLEALAEDGDPSKLASMVSGNSDVISSGTFAIPDGESQAGPAGPGKSYSFTISAMPGDRLSFATMLVQSNDLFLAPVETGIELFDGSGKPVSDITTMVKLWDAGTEKNQEPGIGADQAPRQAAANTGTAESDKVSPVSDGYAYPMAGEVITVTVSPM